MGDWEDSVCNPDCKPVFILYSQTLFDKQQQIKPMSYIKKIEKP